MSRVIWGLTLVTNLSLLIPLINTNLRPAIITNTRQNQTSDNYANNNLTLPEFLPIERNDDVVDSMSYDEETGWKNTFINYTLATEHDMDLPPTAEEDTSLPSIPEWGNKFCDLISTFLNFTSETNDSIHTQWPSNLNEETQPNEMFSISNANYTSEYENRPDWQTTLDRVVTYVMTFNVVGVMLGMGCAIYWKEIIHHLWPPIGIIIGMIGQFIVLPATGFGFSILFKLKPYEALGCLVVSCSPGGSFSNFFSYWVDGDLALSIVMTACSSIIAFVGMPFNLWLYSSYHVGQESSNIVIPYLNIIRSLGFICGPVIVGMIIRHFSEKVATVITKVTSIVAYLGFVTALTGWILLYWKIFVNATSLVYVCATILPITGFTLAYIVAFLFRRTHKLCRTMGIETGSQNMPVALSIILTTFSEPEIRANMLLFPTLYGAFMFSEAFMGVGLYRVMQWRWTKKEQEQSPVNQKAIMITADTAEKYKMCP